MNKTVKLLAASIITLSVNSAIAESGKWYIGVGAGQSSYNDWASEKDMTEVRDVFGSRLGVVRFEGTESAVSEDNDTGYKLFGGYSFHKNIAVELSYLNMGEVEASSSASGTFYDAMDNSLDGDLSATGKAEVDAFTLDASLNFPIASFAALIAKAGIYYADTTLNLDGSSTLSEETFHYSRSENSTGLHYGIGINFKLTEAIGLRAEWERLDSIEVNDGKSDVDLLSAALIYNF